MFSSVVDRCGYHVIGLVTVPNKAEPFFGDDWAGDKINICANA
jgi:hypothetical protein